MSIVAKNLCVTYAGTEQATVAVDGIDLQVQRGEFVSLIGPSGCGKSTLLHALGGLLRPTGGSVTVDDEPVGRPDPRRAAFVFQDYSLLPWKSVSDNVAIGLRFARVPAAERRARAADLLERFSLGMFANAYPGELSGGMQQRVAVARALAMDPDFLLMDEPFGALDEITRRDLGADISRFLTDQGRSVVMVTHSLDEAIFWGDRVVVMSARPGRIFREVNVDLPRPRELSFIADPAFAQTRSELFQALVACSDQKAS